MCSFCLTHELKQLRAIEKDDTIEEYRESNSHVSLYELLYRSLFVMYCVVFYKVIFLSGIVGIRILYELN